MNSTLKRAFLVALPIALAAIAPYAILASTRREREDLDRKVDRDLALYRSHYAESSGTPASALRSQADNVSASHVAGYRAFLDRYAIPPAPESKLARGASLPALAFKDALIRFRERNASRMEKIAVSGSFNTTSFSDLRPEILEEYLTQAAATESFLDLLEGLPLGSVSARVSSGRIKRSRPAEIFTDGLVRVSVRVECRATLEGLHAFLDRLAGEKSPFILEKLDVENPFEPDPSKRSPELHCRLDLTALSGDLLEKPRFTDQRPAWVREVEGL